MEITQTNIKTSQTIISNGGRISNISKEDPMKKSFDQILSIFQLLGQAQGSESIEQNQSIVQEDSQGDEKEFDILDYQQLETILITLLAQLQQKTHVSGTNQISGDLEDVKATETNVYDGKTLNITGSGSNGIEQLLQQITTDPELYNKLLLQLEESSQILNVDQDQIRKLIDKLLGEIDSQERMGHDPNIKKVNNFEYKQPISLDKNQVFIPTIVNQRLSTYEENNPFQALPSIQGQESNSNIEQPLLLSQSLKPLIGSSMPNSTPVMVPVQEFAPKISEWMGQFMRITKGESGSTEARFSLYPEHLGHIEIKISSLQGQLSAQIVTESLLAKEALEGQLQQLKQALQMQGLVIQKIDIQQQIQGTVNNNFANSFLNNGNSHSSQDDQRKLASTKGMSEKLSEEEVKDFEIQTVTYGGQVLKGTTKIDFTA